MNPKNFDCHHCLERAIIHYKIEVSKKDHKQWEVSYCARCGRVTNINEENFSWLNMIPRIGRIKSFVILLLIGGGAIYLVAKHDFLIGAFLGLALLIWNWNISTTPFNWVDACKYKRWEVYPELRGK